MVFDNTDNLHNWRNLVPKLQLIEKFLSKNTIATLDEGRVDLAGDNLFLMVFGLKTKKPQRRLECHKRYADIHMVDGEELVYFADRLNLELIEKYNREKDVEFYTGRKLSSLILNPGKFAIFLPGEPHEPGCAIEKPRNIKKLVFKIKMK